MRTLRNLVLAGLLGGLPLCAQDNEVTSIRHWSLDGATRIAVQVREETEVHVELLQNPDRLFIDLRESSLRINGRSSFRLDVGDKLVKQIRAAQTQATVTRIVLDLNTQIDYEISHLANPHRLMLEVRPKQASAASTTASPLLEKPVAVPAPVIPVTATPEPAAKAVASTPRPLGASLGTPSLPSSAPAPATVIPPLGKEPAMPRPARRNSDGSQSLTRTLGLKLGRVVLDPGHGGKDEGTSTKSGLKEKDLVLDVALRLGTLLEEQLGAEVVYTRKDDTFIPLEERTAIANRSKADLFLSIHANSSASKTAGGMETYFLNFTTSPAEMEIAARENAGTTLPIHELRDLIRKIAMQEKVDESREFAAKVQSSLHRSWTKSGGSGRNRGVKKAPFVVLIGAAMPSVLTEIGFVSNRREETLMKTSAYRQQIAEALAKGISQYVSTLSHFDIAQRQ